MTDIHLCTARGSGEFFWLWQRIVSDPLGLNAPRSMSCPRQQSWIHGRLITASKKDPGLGPRQPPRGPGTRVLSRAPPGNLQFAILSKMKEDEDGRDGPSALHFLCAALLGLFAGYGAVMFGYQVVGGMLPLVPMRPCDAASGAVPAKPGAQRDLGPRSAGGRFPLETLTLMLQKEEPCMSRKPLLTCDFH